VLQSPILHVCTWNSLVGLHYDVKRPSYLETTSVLRSVCDLVSAPTQLVGSWSDRRTSHKGRNLILPVFRAFLD
jgi:hypothetical protein